MTELTLQERKEIELGAKKILDNFASALSKVKSKEKSKKKNIVSGFREEGSVKKQNNDFKERIFANAPSKSGDNLIAETKEW